MLRGTWDLSTLTTDQTHVTCIAKLILCNRPVRKKSPVHQALLFHCGYSCYPLLWWGPHRPLPPPFLLDLHSVPLEFHSPCGIIKGTQDTYITMSGLNCSGELQTLARPPILTADVYHIGLTAAAEGPLLQIWHSKESSDNKHRNKQMNKLTSEPAMLTRYPGQLNAH